MLTSLCHASSLMHFHSEPSCAALVAACLMIAFGLALSKGLR
jgi:hypothetical protein